MLCNSFPLIKQYGFEQVGNETHSKYYCRLDVNLLPKCNKDMCEQTAFKIKHFKSYLPNKYPPLRRTFGTQATIIYSFIYLLSYISICSVQYFEKHRIPIMQNRNFSDFLRFIFSPLF